MYINIVSAFITLISSLVFNILIVRSSTFEVIGDFFVFLLFSQIGMIIFDLGFRNYYLGFYSKVRDKEAGYLKVIIPRLMSFSIVISITLFFIAFLASIFYNEMALLITAFIFGVVTYNNTFLVQSNYIRGRGLLSGFSSLLFDMIRLTSVTSLILYSEINSTNLIICNIAARIIAILPFFIEYKFFSKSKLTFRIGLRLIIKIFNKTKSNYLLSLTSLGSTKVNDILLTSLLSSAFLAKYNIAMQMPSAALRVFELLKGSLLKLLSRYNCASVILRGGVFLSVGLFGIYITREILERIFVMMYHNNDEDIMSGFLFLCNWIVITITNYIFVLKIIQIKKSGALSMINLVFSIVSIFVSYFIILNMGFLGAFYSINIMASLSLLMSSLYLFRYRNIK